MNSKENWELEVRDKVYKAVSKFPKKDQEKISFAIEHLVIDPFAGDIEKMKDEDDVWRRRIGNYRIFFELFFNNRVIYVFRVERRTSSTY